MRVGDVEYPRASPRPGAGVAGADPSMKVAFFALLHDQPLNTPIAAFARDEAGNEAQGELHRQRVREAVQEEPHRARRQVHQSRRAGDPRALARAEDAGAGRRTARMLAGVPARSTASCGGSTPTRSPRSRRRRRRRRSWNGPFVQLGNSQVEASFADHRTYIYNGKEVDQQTHLGFDLAVTAHVPVLAANSGTVRQRELARHLRQLRDHRPRPGRAVALRPPVVVRREGRRHRHASGQTLGRSGMTGLAGGDHLHFTHARRRAMVNPVEWWDRALDRRPRRAEAQGSRGGTLTRRAVGMIAGLLDLLYRLFRSGEVNASTKRLGVRCSALALAVIGGRVRRQQETSSTSAEPSSPAAAPAGRRSTRRPPATSRARSSLDGTAPKNEAIKMNADPVCLREAKGAADRRKPTWSAATASRSANVFVYVKDGLGNYVFDPPTEPAKIDQKECRYHPHVFGMRVGQPLEIVNSDPTLHNIHAHAEGQPGVQQRPADSGHEDDPHLHARRK